jgi:Tol biopolymer transport system component
MSRINFLEHCEKIMVRRELFSVSPVPTVKKIVQTGIRLQNIPVDCIVFVLMAIISGSCENAVSPQIDYHNKILFVSSRNGIEQLYMMNPDGTGIVQITSGPYSHGGGRWSPDAKQIVALTDENWSTDCYTKMVVMNADGTDRRVIGCGSQMAWSPDGKKIFFTYCPSCEIGIYNLGLYSIDPDGNNAALVSRDWAGEATFSPDGKTVAFVYSDPSDSIPQVVIKVMDYPSFTNVRSVGPVGAVAPRFSPNGEEIAFSYGNDVFIMGSDGSNARRITDHVTREHYYFPRWSPDGSKIIFLSYLLDGSQKIYLYMVNRDGTNLHKVLDDSGVSSGDWSK